MSSSRRKRQRPDPPARGGIKPNKSILIVSEGTVTERQYVEGLAQHIGNAGVKVILSKKHGVPRTIVDAAKEECLELRTSYREDYNEIWGTARGVAAAQIIGTLISHCRVGHEDIEGRQIYRLLLAATAEHLELN